MTCPQCHFETRAGGRFCGNCGAPLLVSCKPCGADNPAENKFCGQCGSPLGEPAAGKAQLLSPAPVGELKRVSILFCDLVNSTGLAERLGPEEMHELIHEFMDTALAAVHRYDGSTPQFTGDGFMALFGAPVAYEDHMRRALLAALAIHDAVRSGFVERAAHAGAEIQVHIGIHTGLVVFGSVAGNLRMDPTAIGDAANVAARLQAAAAPGTILASEEAYLIARGYAQFEEVGPLLLKGKGNPIATYRLLGVSHHLSTREDETLGRRPFVNRKGELSVLLDLVRAVEGGHGQALGIVGEAGIGKSRLVAEFRRRVGGAMNWIDGRCPSYGASTPYLVFLDLLRSICGIAETDPPDVIASTLRAVLLEFRMDPQKDSVSLMYLLGIGELESTPIFSNPEGVKAKAFELLRQLCIVFSRRRPLVLAIEDLHWVDNTSEEFLLFLADAVSGARILLLATYRPGYRLPWINKSYAAQIALQPLSRTDSLAVVLSVPGHLDQPVTEAILAKADGNPLFLEQLALHVGETCTSQSVGMVPNTIHDVVSARIDRLPERTKHLLQTASVIGREFSLSLLAALWQGADPIDRHLDELLRLEFINEETARDGVIYVFRHALTQEMAYVSLLERYRRALHTRIGREIEGFYQGRTDEVIDRLALHFGRSDEIDKAVDYAILAAEKAQRGWANSEALTYFGDALRRLQSMPDTEANRLRRVDAVLKQADVRYGLGQYTEYLNILSSIRKLVADLDDPERSAAWHYWTGLLYSVTGSRPELAIEHCREATEIATANGLEEIDAVTSSCLAQVYIVAGRLGDAIESGERALAFFEARADRWWAARTLWFLAVAANYLGDWPASVDYCRRGLDHGAALGSPLSKSVQPQGWARMGAAYIQQGNVERGLQCCEEALAFEPILPRDAALVRAVHGYGQIKAGRFDAGIAELSRALAWLDRSAFRFTYLAFALWLAEGYLRFGDTTSARPFIQGILDASSANGYIYIEGRAHWLMGDCLAAEGVPGAEDHVEIAVQILNNVGARNDLTKALLTRAALRQRNDDTAAARRLLEEALISFRDLGTLDEPARVEAALSALEHGTPIPLLNGGGVRDSADRMPPPPAVTRK